MIRTLDFGHAVALVGEAEETTGVAAIPPAGDLRGLARMLARQEVSDAIATAIADYPGSSHDLQRETGIDPAVISRLLNNRQGATVATLMHIALALGKTLKLSIE
jgi:transcriptional regulator with XRE-family HTH domain